MKERLVEMFRAALASLDVAEHMRKRFADLGDLTRYATVHVIAIGKAAVEMTAAFDALLGSGRASGIVVSPQMPTIPLPHFRYIAGGHPYPNRGSVDAAQAVLELLRSETDPDDLVVFLISGGGSALFESPLITLNECRELYRALVTCGANIYEMNVVRKHFSAVKGGRLAVAAAPATQITLFVSDVPPGKDSTVASGPTMPDESTIDECVEIVGRYDLPVKLTAMQETPKPGDRAFERSRYIPVLANQEGIDALLSLAREESWNAVADISCDDWPVDRAAEHLLEKLRAMPRPACVISGGELSSPVTGDGAGGRNQAFVLACAMRIAEERIAVLSAGTDGGDGNSPAAGAVADGETIARAARLGLDARDYFARSDSHTFFAKLGDTIVTGPTGNNVRDLRLLVAY